MPQLSLGTIEVLGLPAAVEAADVALKTADITLIGYETTDGMGMVAVKIEGQVSAVQAAVAAASAAAGLVSKVFATSVIARPSEQLPPVVYTAETVGFSVPKAAAPALAPAPEPAPVVKPTPDPLVEPAGTIAAPVTEVASSSTSDQPAVEPSPETPVVPVEAPTPRTTSRTRSTKK